MSHAQSTAPTTNKSITRGLSRVHRNTYDMDDPRAVIHAPLGDDGTIEASAMVVEAICLTAAEVQRATCGLLRYSRGAITKVAVDALQTLLDTKHGFQHFCGTNDLSGAQIAKRSGCSVRQWQRAKDALRKLGFLDFVHRSVETGLAKARGVDQQLQISDLYSFDINRLVPWVREIYDRIFAGLARKAGAREKKEGVVRPRRPLVKRDRPPRRTPALLNPIGWARALAAQAAALADPSAGYAAQEARAVAYAKELALRSSPG